MMVTRMHKRSRGLTHDTYIMVHVCLKLRFHLCVMWMRMTNVNATTNRNHGISIGGVLPNVRMRMWTVNATKRIAAHSNRSDCECVIRRVIPSYTEPLQSSRHCVERKLHWSPNDMRHSHSPFIFICITHKWNLSLIQQRVLLVWMTTYRMIWIEGSPVVKWDHSVRVH